MSRAATRPTARIRPGDSAPVPPHSLDSERWTIGSIILDPRRLPEVACIVRPEDFYLPANQLLYQHLLALGNGDGGAIDITLLANRLQDHGDLEEAGGTAYLYEVLNSAPVAAHAVYHAKIVRSKATDRAVLWASEDIYRRTSSGELSGGNAAAYAKAKFEGLADDAAKVVFPVRTAAELVADDTVITFYVNRLLVELQPLVIAGPMKSLKTSILVALMFALATGTSFLAKFSVKRAVRCALLSAESGLATIRDLLIRIGQSIGIDAGDVSNLLIGEDIPTIDNPEHEAGIRQLILEHEIEVLGIDPLYLGNDEDSQSNLTRAGRQLRRLTRVCLEMGVTPVLCHHTKKNTFTNYEPLGLADLHGAGTGEFSRQWMMISRRAPYEHDGRHELWLSAGGSYGHGGLWALDVVEGVWDGPGSRYWQVDVMDADEARGAARDRQQERREADRQQQADDRLEADRQKVVNAMAKFPNGETKTEIRNRTDLSGTRFNSALASLLDDEEVVSCEVHKGNRRTYDGYKLADETPQ